MGGIINASDFQLTALVRQREIAGGEVTYVPCNATAPCNSTLKAKYDYRTWERTEGLEFVRVADPLDNINVFVRIPVR